MENIGIFLGHFLYGNFKNIKKETDGRIQNDRSFQTLFYLLLYIKRFTRTDGVYGGVGVPAINDVTVYFWPLNSKHNEGVPSSQSVRGELTSEDCHSLSLSGLQRKARPSYLYL